jgi:lysozyme
MSTRRKAVWTTAAGVAVLAVLGVLVANGVVWPNRIAAARYDVRGVDVAHYQGEIDWDVLAAQDLDFAWIKATEGASHTDPRFAANWAAATRTDLLVGAYHFMSFESPGADQAAQLAAEVPATPGTLPPVIDLEFYGAFYEDHPSPETVRAIFDPLVAGIEHTTCTSPAATRTCPSGSGRSRGRPGCPTGATGRSGSTRTATGCPATTASSRTST